MDTNSFLFSSLNKAIEKKIFVDGDYALIVSNCGKIQCQNDVIIDVYHVPGFSENLLLVTPSYPYLQESRVLVKSFCCELHEEQLCLFH